MSPDQGSALSRLTQLFFPSIGSTQDAAQDSFNKTGRIHAPGKIGWWVLQHRSGDETSSQWPHHTPKRWPLSSGLGRSRKGPDASIKIPGVLALGRHVGVDLSQCRRWQEQAKSQW